MSLAQDVSGVELERGKQGKDMPRPGTVHCERASVVYLTSAKRGTPDLTQSHMVHLITHVCDSQVPHLLFVELTDAIPAGL